MIKRFDSKLRMAGLEDALQSRLGFEKNTAGWLARLANDVACKNGVQLLAFRGQSQIAQFFWQLEGAGYSGLLDREAAGVPLFAESLAAHRETFRQPSWAAHRAA